MNLWDQLQSALHDGGETPPEGYRTLTQWMVVFKKSKARTCEMIIRLKKKGLLDTKKIMVKYKGGFRRVPHHKIKILKSNDTSQSIK